MTISSLSRTERTANLRQIFKAWRHLNQSELDLHVDTCVAGANTRVMDFTDMKVGVSPFSDSYEDIKDILITMVATAWDDPATGDVIVLYIHEALYFRDRMSHMLLCLNQLCTNGSKVKDVPKQFDVESAHAIIDPTGHLWTPLKMSGMISYLLTRRLTGQEIQATLRASSADRIMDSDQPFGASVHYKVAKKLALVLPAHPGPA
jgi:hypothetical protein